MSKVDEDQVESSSEGDSDSLEDDNDESFKNKNKESDNMMSLFASYYGIDQSSNEENYSKNPENYIDTVHFDSTAFVKKLLLNSPLDELLEKDTKIVQEIKNLDNDMQMLVYENYNKFISATETIKRMKSNVEIMDDDIIAVKLKMDKICITSQSLDDSLHEQRSKVDKLTRIKRLLNRLEFLTELPERLQDMIEREMYQPAVQLYNKTIHVLDKHSGVLSLKNIQERTQSMMKDLTGKVINLLDDTSLETVKLTQYVTILCMMQASKIKVVNKLINAHQYRANSLLNQYSISHDQITLKQLMKFHQLLFSGLIEACNGIYELYCNTEYVNQSTIDNNQLDNEIEQHKQSHAMLLNMLSTILSTYQSIISQPFNHFLKSLKDIYHNVRNVEIELNKLDSKKDNESNVQEDNNIGNKVDNKENLVNSHRRLQLKCYELEEEFQSWLMFIRQSILDHIYLDKCIHECNVFANTSYTFGSGVSGTLSQKVNLTRSQTTDSATSNNHSVSPVLGSSSHDHTDQSIPFYTTKPYAITILSILNDYIDYFFYRRITLLISSLQQSSWNVLSSVVVNKDKAINRSNIISSDNNINASSHGYGSYSDPLGIRYEIQRITSETKDMVDKMIDEIMITFHDLMQEIKPILDIFYTVIPQTIKHHRHSIAKSIPISLTTTNNLFDITTNVLSIDLSTILSSTRSISHDYLSHLSWSFHHCLCQCIEYVYHITYYNYCFDVTSGHYIPDNKHGISLSTQSSIINPLTKDSSLTIHNLLKDIIFNNILSLPTLTFDITRNLFSLIFSQLLNKFSINVLKKIETQLKSLELPMYIKESTYKAKTVSRYELTSKLLLNNFINKISILLVKKSNEAFIDIYRISKYSTLTYITPEQEESIQLSSIFLSVIKLLDYLSTFCCIVYNETLPQLRMITNTTATLSNNTSNNRRGSTIGSRSMVPSNNNVSIDIERLFTQKIVIYDMKQSTIITNSTTGSNSTNNNTTVGMLDIIVGICIKAIIKGIDEYIRILNISHHTYVLIQVQIQILKQVSSHFIKDSNEIDILIDHLNNTLYSRYINASTNNRFIGSPNSNEASVISQAVNIGLVDITKVTNLINKH